MAQRMKACIPCHGAQGVARPDGYYPRIAGKPAGYLHEQLLNFQEGRRGHAAMRHLVQPLSVAYLREMAEHFEALDLPYAPPVPHTAPPAVIERGRLLVQHGDPSIRVPACAACHGQALTGVQPNVPGVLGLSKDYLTAQLGGWRTGLRRAREPDCMGEVSRRLSDPDIHAVSAYLASQPVPAGARAVAAKAAVPGSPGGDALHGLICATARAASTR